MMQSTLQVPSSRHYLPYNYGPQMNIPTSPAECMVLDLSIKSKSRAVSPDYTYCYPSPKSSPNSNPSHDECDPARCCPKSPVENQTELNSRLPSPSAMCITIKEDPDKHLTTMCNPLSSPRSPTSPYAVSETTSEASFHSSDATSECRSPQHKRKIARPFKRMTRDSIALSIGAIQQLDSAYSSPLIIDDINLGPDETKRLMEESARKYAEFREKMLMQLNSSNTTNQNMRRMQNNKDRAQDTEYLEKRRKNNEAAKRSRDARKQKQDEIAIRATFLEQENMMLKFKIQSEIEDLDRIRKMELTRNAQVSC